MIFRPQIILSLILFMLGCTSLPSLTQLTGPSPTATPPLSFATPTVTAEVVPTLQPSPTITLSPQITSTSPAPQVELLDLSLYRQAMRPQFVDDVEQVAATGASRYYIEATLDSGTLNSNSQPKITGSEQIHYTNNESVPLDEIVFRLYPNLPGYGGQMEIDTITIDE